MQFNVQNLFRFTKSVRAFLLVTAAAAVYLFFGPAAPSSQIFFAPSNTIGGLWEEIGWAKAFFPSADCVDAAEPVCMAEFFLNVTKARRARFDSGEVPPSLQTQDNGLDWNLLFALAEGGQPDVALSFSASLEQVSQPKEEAH